MYGKEAITLRYILLMDEQNKQRQSTDAHSLKLWQFDTEMSSIVSGEGACG